MTQNVDDTHKAACKGFCVLNSSPTLCSCSAMGVYAREDGYTGQPLLLEGGRGQGQAVKV